MNGGWGLEIGGWGLVNWSPRLRDTLTRGCGPDRSTGWRRMRADWEVFTHVPHSRDASPHGRDALTRAKSAKDLYHFLGASVREKISHRNTGGGGKSRKGKGWAEPKPKEHIIDKCKIIRIVSHNE